VFLQTFIRRIEKGRGLVRGALVSRYMLYSMIAVGSILWWSGTAQGQRFEDSKSSAADGAPFDRFGTAVDVSGMTAVVGAPRDDDGGSSSGSAYIFEYDGSRWIQTAKLTASDAAITDLFGTSVAISGDVVVIGAPFSSRSKSSAGAVYLFEKPITGWTDMTETGTLNASDEKPGDGFGTAVAIDGDFVVVGASQEFSGGTGKTYVYEKPIDGWQTITESAILTVSSANAGDRIGSAVAISGDVVAVGAPGSDAFGKDAGVILAYQRPIGGWASANETAALWASDGGVDDALGFSVATSGPTIAAGAPFHDGAASNAGATYVFRATQNGWKNSAEEAKLLTSSFAPIDEFGNTIAMETDMIVVGAHKSDLAGSNAGALFVYRKPNLGWTEMFESDFVIASDAAIADGFGTSVAMDDFRTIIGSPFDDDRGSDSGSLYYVDLTPPCFDLQVFNLIAGDTATFVVRNGVPQKRFVVLYGLGGPPTTFVDVRGFCATFGFSFITQKNVMGFGQFDSNGIGSIEVPIAPQMIGFTLKLQAAEKNTCPDECVSNLVKQEVK